MKEASHVKAGLLVLAAMVVAATTAFVLNFVGVFAFTTSDGRLVAADISAALSSKSGHIVNVRCPRSIPEKKGGVEDCEANAGHGTTLVRVVQDDSRGHLHWNVSEPSVLQTLPSQGQASPLRDCTPVPDGLTRLIASRPANSANRYVIELAFSAPLDDAQVITGFLHEVHEPLAGGQQMGSWVVLEGTDVESLSGASTNGRLDWPDLPLDQAQGAAELPEGLSATQLCAQAAFSAAS